MCENMINNQYMYTKLGLLLFICRRIPAPGITQTNLEVNESIFNF